MNFIDSITNYLQAFSNIVPVEIFIFVGALIEEIIAPIPSPIIMTLGGSIAKSQGRALIFLLLLSVIGAIGKIIGSYVLYFIADKAEDVFVTKFGKFLGITAEDVSDISEYFSKGKKDFIVIFFARLIPIMPTAPISVIAGLIELNLKTYMLASFLGYLGRNFIYLYFGYVGFSSYENIVHGLDSVESVVQVLLALTFMVILGGLYYKRSKAKGSGDILRSFIKKGKSVEIDGAPLEKPSSDES